MKNIDKISAKQLVKTICMLFLIHVMISGALAQESILHHEQDLEREELLKTDATPDKSTPIMLNVEGGGARIHGITVGRGGGNIDTNSAFGNFALRLNTSGDRNTAIGSFALMDNTIGRFNTAVGRWAMRYNTGGNYNTAMGFVALRNNQGHFNTAIGYQAMERNTTGFSNVAVGNSALLRNIVGSNLVAVGDSALFTNGEGATESFHATANTALGSKALYANTTGYRNTATGSNALENNTIGKYNVATGFEALRGNTTGTENTAVGRAALRDLTGGSHSNTAIGYSTAWNYPDINQGTFLGSSSNPTANNLINVTGIGYNSRPTKNNQLVLGNTSVAENLYYGTWASGSDARYKNNVKEDVSGLDFILKLRPVTYNLDVHKLAGLLQEDSEMDQDGNKTMGTPSEATLKARDEKSAIVYSGLIAQEVEAAAREAGYDFYGVNVPQNDHEYYSLDYISLTVPIIKAIQEQQQQIELLEPAAVEALQVELQEVKEKNQQLESKVDQILALLLEQGIEPGDHNAAAPSRVGSDRTNRTATDQNAHLEQNTPNPFQENTVIRYFLPQDAARAQLIVTDLQGNRIQTNSITGSGPGELTIHGGTLSPGIYVYSLVIKGQVVDSKRMVLL